MEVIVKNDAKVGNYAVAKGRRDVPNWVAQALFNAGIAQATAKSKPEPKAKVAKKEVQKPKSKKNSK